MSDFADDVKSGDRRRSLTAIRDYLTERLEATTTCPECGETTNLTGSEVAALTLRLTKVLEQIAALPSETKPARGKKVTDLASIRDRRAARTTGGTTGTDGAAPARLGTKAAPRRQGGRKRRSAGGT